MKMRRKVLLITLLGLLLVLLPVLILTITTANAYFKNNFYTSIDPILKASSLSLQTDIARGSALSFSFSENQSLLRFLESGESSETDAQVLKATMLQLSKIQGFATTFLATKDKGSYYIVKDGKVIRDQLYPTEEKDAWFYTILALPDDVLYNLDYNKTLDQTLFWFDQKVYNDKKEPIALAGVAIDLSSAVTLMMESLPSKNSSVSFADSDGLISISSDKEKLNARISDLIGTSLESVKGYPELQRYTSKFGDTILARRNIWTSPYQIVLSIPEKDFVPSTINVMGLPLAIGLIFAVAIGFISALLIRLMFRKFDQMENAMQQIAELDLTPTLEASSTDEIATINGYVNKALTDIRSAMDEVKSESLSMKDFTRKLSNHIETSTSQVFNITEGIQDISSAVNNQSELVSGVYTALSVVIETLTSLNSRIEVQASNISEATSAVTEMVANIQSVTDILKQNKESFSLLQSASDRALNSTNQTANVVRKISDDSEGLLEAISVIQNIATQTNLLAMNAAIEAAHAGEAGLGFAVVADEIRKLAEESNAQGQSISVVLKNLKSEIENVSGHSLAMQAAFSEISEHTTSFEQQEQTIMAAMQEQSEGSGAVLKAMTKISEITHEVKLNSAEIKNQGDESSEKINQLMQRTEEITNVMTRIAQNAADVVGVMKEVNALSEENTDIIERLAVSIARFRT